MTDIKFYSSSAESVGSFWLRESAKRMVEGYFYCFVGPKPIGFSGYQFFLVVQALYRTQ